MKVHSAHGGRNCPDLAEKDDCPGNEDCPEHCGLSDWGAWGPCSHASKPHINRRSPLLRLSGRSEARSGVSVTVKLTELVEAKVEKPLGGENAKFLSNFPYFLGVFLNFR